MGTFATAKEILGSDVIKLAKIKEPEEYDRNDNMIISPLPEEEAKTVEIVRGPNIQFLPVPDVPEQYLKVPVSLKGGDNISTDDITPASAEFSSMRSNIPLMSQYCYHRYAPDFAARAKELGKSIIIGGENYGQGSSREHAAINPMLFANPDDYEKIQQGDELEIIQLLDQIPTRKVHVKNVTRNFTFEVTLDLTNNEVDVLLSGGQLRYLKKQL